MRQQKRRRPLSHWSPVAPVLGLNASPKLREATNDLGLLQDLIQMYLALPESAPPPLPMVVSDRRTNKLSWSIYQLALRASGAERRSMGEEAETTRMSSSDTVGTFKVLQPKSEVPPHTVAILELADVLASQKPLGVYVGDEIEALQGQQFRTDVRIYLLKNNIISNSLWFRMY